MAAVFKCFPATKSLLISFASPAYLAARCMGVKVPKKRKVPYVEKTFKSPRNVLAARGFMRNYRPYNPPEDTPERIFKICAQLNVDVKKPYLPISDPALRFSVLNKCFKEFDHSVPNSLLYQIHCINDLIEFYQIEVSLNTPYDNLKNMDLPKNLHVQQQYVRFHPDTDTVFGGISAFPGQSTLISGLRSRKKYQGYTAEPIYE